jgi:hypothetical protein
MHLNTEVTEYRVYSRAPQTQDGRYTIHLGLRTEFGSEKILRNRLGTVPVIPRKEVFMCSFRGIPRALEESVPKLGTERNSAKI